MLGAVRLLAHRVELVVAHQRLQRDVVGAARHSRREPGWEPPFRGHRHLQATIISDSIGNSAPPGAPGALCYIGPELRDDHRCEDVPTGESRSQRRPELATLTLEKMGALGDTMAPFEDERINVFGGIPGETVVARIVRYRRRRKRHVSAIVTEVLDPSPHRVRAAVPLVRAVQRLPVAAHRLRPPAGTEGERRTQRDGGVRGPARRHGVRARSLRRSSSDTVTTAASPCAAAAGSASSTASPAASSTSTGACSWRTASTTFLGKLDGRSQETSQLSVRYGINTVRRARAAQAQERGDTAADRTDALHGRAPGAHFPHRRRRRSSR